MISLRRTPCFAAAVLVSCSVFAQSTTTPPPDAPTPQSTTQSAPSSTQAAPSSSLPDAPDLQARPSPQPTGATVIYDTSMGRMTCKLFDKQAPEASSNFVGLTTGTKDSMNPATKHK